MLYQQQTYVTETHTANTTSIKYLGKFKISNY